MFSNNFLLPCVATAVYLSTAAHASVIAVNFGGDMSDSRNNSSLDEGGQVQLSTGDFDGNTVTDSRFLIPMDHAGTFASIPNPTVSNINTIWRAGTEVINYGTSDPSPGTLGAVYRYNGQGITSDYLQAGSAANSGASVGMVFAPHVEKAEFLNGASAGQTVSFADDASGFFWDWNWQDGSATAPKNTTLSRQTRATVKNGNTWYLSDTVSSSRGNDPNDGIGFNPATTTWYEWDVNTSLFFDDVSAGTGVLGSTFTDIQALGAAMMLNADTNTSTNGIIPRLDGINVSVDFTTPPPPTPQTGKPIVYYEFETTSVESVEDAFGNTWTGIAAPDLSTGPTDPMFYGDTSPVSGITFDAVTQPATIAGPTGQALDFDGVDDQTVAIRAWNGDPNDPKLDRPAETFDEVYISLDFSEDSNTSGLQQLAGARNIFAIRINPNGEIEWLTTLADGSAHFLTAALDPDTSDWHNVEAFHAADGTKALFLDGELVAQAATGQGLLPDTVSIVLGNREGQARYYAGLLDNVRVSTGIPEPTSLALISAGGLMAVRRRRA